MATNSILVLALDPGPARTGYAVLQWRSMAARPHFVTGAHVDNALIPGLLHRYAGRLALCAIETPGGYIHAHARGAQLLATARVAGELVALAKGLGYRVLELTQAQWSRALCGKGVRGTPGDRHVKRAVHALVVDMPDRSSTHVRDAIGLAVVALWNRAPIAKGA